MRTFLPATLSVVNVAVAGSTVASLVMNAAFDAGSAKSVAIDVASMVSGDFDERLLGVATSFQTHRYALIVRKQMARHRNERAFAGVVLSDNHVVAAPPLATRPGEGNRLRCCKRLNVSYAD
jgi:hypothetical protein